MTDCRKNVEGYYYKRNWHKWKIKMLQNKKLMNIGKQSDTEIKFKTCKYKNWNLKTSVPTGPTKADIVSDTTWNPLLNLV